MAKKTIQEKVSTKGTGVKSPSGIFYGYDPNSEGARMKRQQINRANDAYNAEHYAKRASIRKK